MCYCTFEKVLGWENHTQTCLRFQVVAREEKKSDIPQMLLLCVCVCVCVCVCMYGCVCVYGCVRVFSVFYEMSG